MERRFIGPEKEPEVRPFKCTGCGKLIENPSAEEAYLSRCDQCTEKEEEGNP